VRGRAYAEYDGIETLIATIDRHADGGCPAPRERTIAGQGLAPA